MWEEKNVHTRAGRVFFVRTGQPLKGREINHKESSGIFNDRGARGLWSKQTNLQQIASCERLVRVIAVARID